LNESFAEDVEDWTDAPDESDAGPTVDSEEQEFRAARVLFYSLLDEQQRRLYAGLESRRWGHGGDRQRNQPRSQTPF